MMKATAWHLSIIALFKIYKKKQQQKKEFHEHKIKIKTKVRLREVILRP